MSRGLGSQALPFSRNGLECFCFEVRKVIYEHVENSFEKIQQIQKIPKMKKKMCVIYFGFFNDGLVSLFLIF